MAVRVVGKKGNLQASIEDANGDAIDDLMMQIEDIDGVFEIGAALAIPTGQLYDGTKIQGDDVIHVNH